MTFRLSQVAEKAGLFGAAQRAAALLSTAAQSIGERLAPDAGAAEALGAALRLQTACKGWLARRALARVRAARREEEEAALELIRSEREYVHELSVLHLSYGLATEGQFPREVHSALFGKVGSLCAAHIELLAALHELEVAHVLDESPSSSTRALLSLLDSKFPLASYASYAAEYGSRTGHAALTRGGMQ
ncbi:hypothetical protein T492DRAFT_849883 [Pavlovales sp. CCMP2436]|nr:hypothetical protein T492DRAFT_849883 [Pavlovales sp. CCMP2436]